MTAIKDKPGRLIRGGFYHITIDGYLICAVRRNTALKGMAMRPTLEYGNLVYRPTFNGKTTSIRAFMVVREVWGEEMHDPGDFREMCARIDAHNAAVRSEHREKQKTKFVQSKPSRPMEMCPYCNTKPIRNNSTAKTCGDSACVLQHDKVSSRARSKRQRAAAVTPRPASILGKPSPGPWKHDMKCPWEHALFDQPPAPGVSWYSAEADPMTLGAWTGEMQHQRVEEVAA